MAVTKQRMVIGKLVENRGISIYRAMIASGYSEAYASNPKQLMETKSFTDLLEEHIPDSMLLDTHTALLKSKRIDNLIFPLGPRTNAEKPAWVPDKANGMSGDDVEAFVEATQTGVIDILSDEDLVQMVEEIGGTVRRIVHGRTARRVYFWAPNDKSRADALKLAYDVKGKLAKKDGDTGDTYNTFIQQNNVNPNTPSSKELVQKTLDAMMDQTKRKAIDVTPGAK
jgi:hypothetical protein